MASSRLKDNDGVLAPALVGGLVALALAVFLRGATSTTLLAEIVVDASTSTLGPRGFSLLLEVLGPAGKPLLFFTVLVAELALYLLAWRHQAGTNPGIERLTHRVMAAAGEVALVLIAFSIGMVAFTDAELRSGTGWFEFGMVTVLCSIVYAGVAGLLTVAQTPVSSRYEEEPDRLRRGLLVGLPMLVLGGFALTVIGGALKRATGGGVQRSRPRGPTPELTATDDYYLVSKNLLDPAVNAERWRLRVGGATQHMLELTYDDILQIPVTEQITTMQCISNGVGGDLMSNASWTGFPLATLIDRAGALATARYVGFRCEDDYTECIPIEFARQEGVMLAHRMNGAPLPDKHGFPLRLLSPGKYGIKHPKWITEIALMDEEFLGYWQKRGWTQEARMNTSCRIDVPEDDDAIQETPYRIQGVAFSGDRGISRVEVSVNNGAAWEDAVLKPALGKFTWVLWYYDWNGTDAMRRDHILARATDGTGEVQTANQAFPYPSGATGYPSVDVRFELGS